MWQEIFVTTYASSKGSGAILAFGLTYDLACPVTYDSWSFKEAKLNYPVHKKELLAIIWPLGKWQTDLLGHRFEIWTDHKTLEHFENQKDMLRQQACWMEFLSQYDASINYIPGEKNCVANALSCLPETSLQNVASIFSTSHARTTFSWLELDTELLKAIRMCYKNDSFIAKLMSASASMSIIRNENDYWFISKWLVIPNVKHIHKSLFWLAHDALGHFSSDKSLASLRGSFYWPNMQCNLKTTYIPSCTDCQQNKGSTTKPAGPLHPLPIPDSCNSVAIDFIGPLPMDQGFDMTITFTDRLGSDIQIIPSISTLTTEELADIFFNRWYCENGLPLDIIRTMTSCSCHVFGRDYTCWPESNSECQQVTTQKLMVAVSALTRLSYSAFALLWSMIKLAGSKSYQKSGLI